MSEWISVEDNSPNTPDDCLVVLRGQTASGYLGASGQWYVYSFGESNMQEVTTEATHWMPYLEPPK